jgi:hypothetical protein
MLTRPGPHGLCTVNIGQVENLTKCIDDVRMCIVHSVRVTSFLLAIFARNETPT